MYEEDPSVGVGVFLLSSMDVVASALRIELVQLNRVAVVSESSHSLEFKRSLRSLCSLSVLSGLGPVRPGSLNSARMVSKGRFSLKYNSWSRSLARASKEDLRAGNCSRTWLRSSRERQNMKQTVVAFTLPCRCSFISRPISG